MGTPRKVCFVSFTLSDRGSGLSLYPTLRASQSPDTLSEMALHSSEERESMILARSLKWIHIIGILIIFFGYSQRAMADWPQYSANPFVIQLDIPAEDDGVGGIVVADVNGDHLLDYLVTKPGFLAVYHHSGGKLWVKKIDVRVAGEAETNGLPGWHGPGVQAADVDGDGQCEVLFLTNDGTLHILEGATGRNKKVVKPTLIPGVEK